MRARQSRYRQQHETPLPAQMPTPRLPIASARNLKDGVWTSLRDTLQAASSDLCTRFRKDAGPVLWPCCSGQCGMDGPQRRACEASLALARDFAVSAAKRRKTESSITLSARSHGDSSVLPSRSDSDWTAASAVWLVSSPSQTKRRHKKKLAWQ